MRICGVIMPTIFKEGTSLHLLGCLLTYEIHDGKAIFYGVTYSGDYFIQCGRLNLLAEMRAQREG